MKIIAEAGCNHITLCEAIEFINKSKELGLWATKFQIYSDAQIVDNPHREFLKSIMIDSSAARILFEHGQDIEQEVFFTPMYDCISDLEAIGVNYYKIRYADRNNLDLRTKIMQTGKTYFMSKSKAMTKFSPNEIDLFCVPEYPARIQDYLKEAYSFMNMRGISGHTSNLELLQIAKILDVAYFEKHVCLTKDCLEADWSSTFDELEEVLK